MRRGNRCWRYWLLVSLENKEREEVQLCAFHNGTVEVELAERIVKKQQVIILI